MSKHAARRAAVQLVYENILGGEGGDDTLFGLIKYPKDDEDMAFVYELFDGATKHSNELDNIISDYSPKRELSRIPVFVRATLRIALYEIIYHSDTSVSVAINEAVEIIKRYSEPSEAVFVNGLLGAYSKACSADGG